MGGVADPPAYRTGRMLRLAALDRGRGGRIRRIPRQCLGFSGTGMSGDMPVADLERDESSQCLGGVSALPILRLWACRLDCAQIQQTLSAESLMEMAAHVDNIHNVKYT